MLNSPWATFVVICILHYSITQSLFIALKSCVLPVFPPFLSPWWVNCWSFYGLHSSRMSCSWKHTYVAFSHWLLSLSNVHLSFVHVLIAHFKVLNNIPLSGLSIHWPKDIFVASNFWQLQIGPLYTSIHSGICLDIVLNTFGWIITSMNAGSYVKSMLVL